MRIAVALVLWFGLSGSAWAQHTGGSAGGAHFSGGGGGHYSGGGGHYSGSGYHSSYSGGGGGSDDNALAVIGVLLGGGLLIFFIAAAARVTQQGAAAGGPSMRLVVVKIGLEPSARRPLQQLLLQLARSGKTSTLAGLAQMLHETVIALRRARGAWAYAHVSPVEPLRRDQAEPAFRRAAMEARARFTTEIVRGAEGETRERAVPAEVRARPVEGEGFVVVTLIVVTHGDLPADLDGVMSRFAELTGVDLVALELVWSPAADEDRMSSAELQRHYPELVKLEPSRPIGEATCKYCAARYPGELLKCPNCGAALA